MTPQDPIPPWDDWNSWAVLADRLTQVGDPRGPILMLDLEQVQGNLQPTDERWMYEQIDEELGRVVRDDALLASWDKEIDAVDRYNVCIRDLALVRPVLPEGFDDVLRHRPAQVLAMAGTGAATNVMTALLERLVAWVERVFDAIPPPDFTLAQGEAADAYRNEERAPGDSEGPWQDVPDAYLLANQWALVYLTPSAMQYYLPSLMRFYLRDMLVGDPRDHSLFDSLDFHLGRQDYRFQDGQRAWFEVLTRDQRAAVAGYCWAYGLEDRAAWVRSALAETGAYDVFLGDMPRG